MPRLIWIFAGCTSFYWFCHAAAHFVYRFFRSYAPILTEWPWPLMLTFALAGMSLPLMESCYFKMIWAMSWDYGTFILHKLVLKTRLCSLPVRLDVWFLVGPFVYFHTICVQTAKALVRLRGCAGSPGPSLVAYVISTIISWGGSFQILPKRPPYPGLRIYSPLRVLRMFPEMRRYTECTFLEWNSSTLPTVYTTISWPGWANLWMLDS